MKMIPTTELPDEQVTIMTHELVELFASTMILMNASENFSERESNLLTSCASIVCRSLASDGKEIRERLDEITKQMKEMEKQYNA